MRELGGSVPWKADLYLVDLGAGPLVVKDFGAKRWWVRQVGRVQIARECRAYAWLGPQPGLARFAGRIDAHALALEWIEGELLTRSRQDGAGGAALLARVQRVVARLHAAGLAHLDLRGRNVVVRADGEVYVLDLAGALWFRPGSLAHRVLFPLARAIDLGVLLKWKRWLAAGSYTAAEEALLARRRFWRSLWPFNRKRRRGAR